jgi:hypothetical protein
MEQAFEGHSNVISQTFDGKLTGWSTTLSTKVNIPHVIYFRAKCGGKEPPWNKH